MRRSSIWFVIAVLWLVDTVLSAVRLGAHHAWLPAVVTLCFAAVGIVHRRWEDRTLYRK